MLVAENLTKNYGDLAVLKGVSLSIEAAEILSIVGASGAGKSTLLHLLGTLDTPSSGRVLMEGVDITQLSEKDLAALRNRKMGFIFQFHNLMAELTAFENVLLPAWILKTEREASEKTANELLDLLHLSHRKNHFPSQLSGGEQQRVAVARALINRPRVVFADEPSGNLDSKNAEELHQLFFVLRENFNSSFVIVTHNEEFANRADRKLVMQDGRLLQ